MAKIPGLNISAPVVPSQDSDTYPSHRAIYGQGGWRTVSDIQARNAIPEPRKEAGMAVYVTSEKKVYILDDDLTTWTELTTGGSTITWGSITGTLSEQTDLNEELTSLQTQINSISGRGQYLTLWNCATGLAETNPPESPYTYHTGDYFIIGTVAAAGGTNYRPNGSSYTTGVASSVVETDEVNVDDTYIFDGTSWHLLYNSQKTVSFANIDGNPTDNAALSNALDQKVSTTSESSKVYGTDSEGNQTTYSITDLGGVTDVQLNGVSVVVDTVANIVPEAQDIAYTNDQYPSMENLQDAMDKLLYVDLRGTLSGGGTYEIGYTKESTSLTWTWNKSVVSQSLNQGIGSLAINVRSYTYDTPITTDTTFTISGNDGTKNASASTTIKFSPKRYWGVSTKTSLTDEEIIALSSELSTSRQQKRTFNCSGGKYFYFVIKTSYCSGIQFKVGGLAFTDMILTTRQFTNASGYTDMYNIYRVNNIQTGSAIEVEVL